MGRAYFMVRAEVPEAERAAFDRWYEVEHLPDAVQTFKAVRAWRCWSRINPEVHMAFYEFEALEQAQAIGDSEGLKRLIADFNAAWGDRVPRSREVLEVVGAFEG